MDLTKENLYLYRIVSNESVRHALTGIHINPRAKVTAASNGSMLVEVAAPSGGPGDKESEPFILPAKVAQQLAKELGDGAKARVGDDNGKPALFSGKKVIPFEPIDAVFPDYTKADLFSGKGDPITLTFNADYLKQVLAATSIGKTVTLSIYNDRLRIESKKDDGQAARGVLMCCGQPAPASKTEARAERAPKPKVEKPAVEAPADPAPARFRRWGRYRKPFVAKAGDPNKPPTERQRMLYTFFLRRQEEEITPEILASTDFVGKIEELKKALSFDPDFATWNQWLKVNYLLLEQQADPETVCEVLNGIADKKSASEAISSLSKKSVPVAA